MQNRTESSRPRDSRAAPAGGPGLADQPWLLGGARPPGRILPHPRGWTWKGRSAHILSAAAGARHRVTPRRHLTDFSHLTPPGGRCSRFPLGQTGKPRHAGGDHTLGPAHKVCAPSRQATRLLFIPRPSLQMSGCGRTQQPPASRATSCCWFLLPRPWDVGWQCPWDPGRFQGGSSGPWWD